MNYDLMYSADFYKVSHKAQYPTNVTKVHSTLVARSGNLKKVVDNGTF